MEFFGEVGQFTERSGFLELCVICDIIHGCMVYGERAETAVVSRGTSHVTTKQCCKYTAWVIVKTCCKNLLSLNQIHRQERSRTENSAI